MGDSDNFHYCCQCGDGPYGFASHVGCMLCGHQRCAECAVDSTSKAQHTQPSLAKSVPKIFQDSSSIDFPKEDFISETASELSFQDSGYGSSSSGNAGVIYGFTHEIVTDLASNSTIKCLLLDHLSTDTAVNEKFRGFLVDALPWEILSRLGFVLAPSRFGALQSQQVEKSKMLEDYLAKRAHKSVEEKPENETEDESDGEEVDTMPNLSQAKKFLYEGPAFQLFIRQLQQRSLPSKKPAGSKLLEKVYKISELPKGGSDALNQISWYPVRPTISFLALQMPSRLCRIFESPSQPGKVRLRWTCRCGKPMYDDYKELVPGAVQKFEQELVNHFNQAAGGSTEPQGAGRRTSLSGISSWITYGFQCLWGSFKRSEEEELPITRDQASRHQTRAATSLIKISSRT
ncbi:hypothetical protein AOQ84DRAFT_364488 [Glonium stellatum]|uniref:Uncharacterized protein n=1 Tax=Glonium stellatum TaxID=574774 RepID=A0A8E2EZX5_9PEZI|nr:hypothetical protein AOQ84DRAFT_364488 [Glonium stellatum]